MRVTMSNNNNNNKNTALYIYHCHLCQDLSSIVEAFPKLKLFLKEELQLWMKFFDKDGSGI